MHRKDNGVKNEDADLPKIRLSAVCWGPLAQFRLALSEGDGPPFRELYLDVLEMADFLGMVLRTGKALKPALRAVLAGSCMAALTELQPGIRFTVPLIQGEQPCSDSSGDSSEASSPEPPCSAA